MNDIQFILMFVGCGTILGIIILVCLLLWEAATDKIRDLKWQYKRKHRFDKPPTAKCYCKDCKYYAKPYYGRCTRGHIETRNIADNYFCWQAEPLKKDPELVDKDK